MIENLCGNAIDWDATGSMLSGIGTIGGVIAVLVAAVIARNTFDDWRKQKLAERHMDHAEAILAATYKIRTRLHGVRALEFSKLELEEARSHLQSMNMYVGFAEQMQERMTISQAYLTRIKGCLEAREKLLDLCPTAKAYWRDDLEMALRELNSQFATLHEAVSEYVQQTADTPQEDQARVRLVLFYSEGGRENPMSTHIDQLVQQVEDICLPVLRT